MTLRIVLADDSVLLREGIARLLVEAGFEVVAQAGDATQLPISRHISGYQIVEGLSLLRGNHSLKVGGELRLVVAGAPSEGFQS